MRLEVASSLWLLAKEVMVKFSPLDKLSDCRPQSLLKKEGRYRGIFPAGNDGDGKWILAFAGMNEAIGGRVRTSYVN